MAADSTVLAMLPPQDEKRAWVYLLRVPGYLLIVVAIVRKNTKDADEE